MKKLLAVVIVGLIILLSVQAALAKTEEQSQAGGGQVIQKPSSGGYHLISVTQPEDEVARGGHFRLSASGVREAAQGSGCCCNYLPCILKQP